MAAPLESQVPVPTLASDPASAVYLRSKGIDPKKPLQLDMWPADVREMPNDVARSALFTVTNKTAPRQTMQNHVVFHVEKNVKITFTGVELRADDDEIIWLQILDYAKHQPLGEPVEFNLHQMCKDVGWSINARNYERVRLCISRLKANEFRLENQRVSGGRGIAVSLIHHYEFEGAGEKGTKYKAWIHPNMIYMFAGRNSTRVAWVDYRNVSPVARRLYDYFASHKDPFPLKLMTFHSMCASKCKTGAKWRSMVVTACNGLVAAGLVRRAWVDVDDIYCER